MKSNQMEREKYNAVPPTGQEAPRVVGPFYSVCGGGATISACSEGGIDYVVNDCPPC